MRNLWHALPALLLSAALSLSAPNRAAAQATVSVRLSTPDVVQFPVVRVFASVGDQSGRRVPGLSAEDFQVSEDQAVVAGTVVDEAVVGTRQIFVVNTVPGMNLRDAAGRTRFQVVRDELLRWWQIPGAGQLGVDDLTLLTGEGALVAHSSSVAQLASALDRYEPTAEAQHTDLELVLEALDFASDPERVPGCPAT